MDKALYLFVKFGDYIILHVDDLQGTVVAPGFTNKNVYLQMNPQNHSDCFTRSKRGFVFVIYPKMSYDARKEYQSAVSFFEKNYNEVEEEEEQQPAETQKNLEKKTELSNESNESDGKRDSYFAGSKPKKKKLMNAAMRLDRDTYKEKIKTLERKLKDEDFQNSKLFEAKLGQIVEYGNELQLFHYESNCFLNGLKGCADEDNSCTKLELAPHGSKAVAFTVYGGFKYKKEGDRIHYNDAIVLYHNKTGGYLHVSEKLLKIEGLDKQIAENLSEGQRYITPKTADRRQPIFCYAPYCEVNLSSAKTKFQIHSYRYCDEDPQDQFIKGGSVVRLFHSERSCYVHSDDHDFSEGGLNEVILWNFKGKQTDPEALSSFSLFEIEVCENIAKREAYLESLKVKSSAAQDKKNLKDINGRCGQVLTYADPNDLYLSADALARKIKADTHFRLRHLGSGRLVVDQEINFNQINMKTLGLAPHLVLKNLSSLSEKEVSKVRAQLKETDNAENYEIEDLGDFTPKDYEDLDRRSRFKIFPTSPSEDVRIYAHSCVQIQHVISGNYLSYEVQTIFPGEPSRQPPAETSQRTRASRMDRSRVEGEEPKVSLYQPVGDEDIQTGTRDAIELKQDKLNEDAYFVIPEPRGSSSDILFIQVAIDNLQKYLPVICSKNLEISKDKQNKIFDLLTTIENFIIGDTKLDDSDIGFCSAFSKAETDQEWNKQENLRKRQKLCRELFMVEALVHIIYLPFTRGEYKLDEIKTNYVIARIVYKAYNLVRLVGFRYYQNELYVSQWINLYFSHAMQTTSVNNIGCREALISLVDNNKKLLEVQITTKMIQQLAELCVAQNRSSRLLDLIRAIAALDAEPVVQNQNDIVKLMLEDEPVRDFLLMPIRAKGNQVEFFVHGDVDSDWLNLEDFRKIKKDTYRYFLSLVDLSAELCLGRNRKALTQFQDVYSFEAVKTVIQKGGLPFEMRALFIRVLLNLHMDREPLESIQVPQMTGIWHELDPFSRDLFSDPDNITYAVKQSKIAVPAALHLVKKYCEDYLGDNDLGVQNIAEVGRNMMTLEILKMIQFMLNHGFYINLKELKQLAIPMINLLNGSNDIYFTDEEAAAGAVDRFVSVNRYFSDGDTDMIVQSKAIICENLLTISQIEIDGKANVFLSMFKSDLDMQYLQKQIRAKAKSLPAVLAEPGGLMQDSCLPSCCRKPSKVADSNDLTKFAPKENDYILFLDTLAQSYNFESVDQDAYICVLFDLSLYKYPKLQKAVFELLIRFFNRKTTLLESLMRIQMLENPRSIQVLKKVQQYHKELKRYTEDADEWLNKTNQPSKKIKYRVSQIFSFFCDVCVESTKMQLQEEEEVSVMYQADHTHDHGKPGEPNAHRQGPNPHVNIQDFVLFREDEGPPNKENQRTLNSFGVESIAIFLLKYRVERSSIKDPLYQQLIHQCLRFLVQFVRDNIHNQLRVYDYLDYFMRDIEKNSLICKLIYEIFKDNKKFLTLNVSKILRVIIIASEESSLSSSKKALYFKLLEVFCKCKEELVRPNQQEIIINFTKDISNNNLFYLFSVEGLPQLVTYIKLSQPQWEDLNSETLEPQEPQHFSMEIFSIIVCVRLMSICCEGKSDLAEIKCQNEIINLQIAQYLYKNSVKLWPFKGSILHYVSNIYLESGNPRLISEKDSPHNVASLKEIIQLVAADMILIFREWHMPQADYPLIMPDGRVSTFHKEAQVFAFEYVTSFFKRVLKNKRIELGPEMRPYYRDLTVRIAKMYYETNNSDFREGAMDVLVFINTTEKFARLLDNITHPANQNIYLDANKNKGPVKEDEVGQKSSKLTAKLMQLAYSADMLEKKEKEFDDLCLWVLNIDARIKAIMAYYAVKNHETDYNPVAYKNVTFSTIMNSLMKLLDSKELKKELHLTGLVLLRKIIEVENKELVTPSADWNYEDWSDLAAIIELKQNQLNEIGCIEFLCKHFQEVDDEEILEETILLAIALLLGGNKNTQDSFYNYCQAQDSGNLVFQKLRRLLQEQFNSVKKLILQKNAKLLMIFKYNEKLEQREEKEKAKREVSQDKTAKKGAQKAEAEQSQEGETESEDLLTFDLSDDDAGPQKEGDLEQKPDAEAALANKTKSDALTRCIRVLRFIQLLTEGQHTELQHFLRTQASPQGVVKPKAFDFIEYAANMFALYEKQFLNCYSVALGTQLMNTLTESVQGPCRANQAKLVEAKIIDCCRDLIQQGQTATTELAMRGFTTEEKLEMHLQLKVQAIKLLLSIIEGSVDIDIYNQLADSFEDFSVLTKRLEIVYTLFVTQELGLDENATVEQVMASLRKDSFKGAITEGFNIYCLINQLAIAIPTVDEILKRYSATNFFLFFKQNTGNVEIQKEDDVTTIYFPVQPVTRFLTAATKDEFTRNVNRESNQHKIIELIEQLPQFIDEMEHLEERSHDFIKITPSRLQFFRNVSTSIAICCSAMVTVFYKYERVEQADGTIEFYATIDALPQFITEILGYIQIFTSLMLVAGFCLNKINIIVKTGWRHVSEHNREKMINQVKYVLNPLQSPFAVQRAGDFPLEAARVLLLTEGPYHPAFLDSDTGRFDFHYVALVIEQKWISLSLLMQNGEFIFCLIYLSLSLQGVFQSPVFYSFQLLDVINQFPQLEAVTQSVTTNVTQLIMTAMLIFIMIYIFSAFGFIFLSDHFYDDNIHSGVLDRKGDSFCMSLMHCFLSFINYGLRGGGGIADALQIVQNSPGNRQTFYFRIVFDLGFFLIVTVILFDIVTGIIIDTFAELRDEKSEKEEDIRNVCFICNIERQIFERDTTEGFEFHIAVDHDVWQYMNFIIHLKSIDPIDLNGTESYILELFEKADLSWFPMQKSLRLIMNRQRAEEQRRAAEARGGRKEVSQDPSVGDPLTAIPHNLLQIVDIIGEIASSQPSD